MYVLTTFAGDEQHFIDGRLPVNHEGEKRDEERLPLFLFLRRQNHATFHRMSAVKPQHRRTSGVDQRRLHQQLKMKLQRGRVDRSGRRRSSFWLLNRN